MHMLRQAHVCRLAAQHVLSTQLISWRGVQCKAAALSSVAALSFDKHGEPSSVLQLRQQQLTKLGDNDVRLQILAVSLLLCALLLCILAHNSFFECLN
jgi:hypothetical protein